MGPIGQKKAGRFKPWEHLEVAAKGAHRKEVHREVRDMQAMRKNHGGMGVVIALHHHFHTSNAGNWNLEPIGNLAEPVA